MRTLISRTVLLACFLLTALQPGMAQTDSKSSSTGARRFFNLDEPDASEILPNVPRGVGNPPRLFLFGPVGRVGAASSVYGTQDINGRYSEVGGSGGASAGARQAPQSTSSVTETTPPRDELTRVDGQSEREMHAEIARQIEQGEGSLAFRPSEQAERDERIYQSEQQRYWDSVERLADQLDAQIAATASSPQTATSPGDRTGSGPASGTGPILTERQQRQIQQSLRSSIARQIATTGAIAGYRPSARAARDARLREAEKAAWRAGAKDLASSLRREVAAGRRATSGRGRARAGSGTGNGSGGGRFGNSRGNGRSRFGARSGAGGRAGFSGQTGNAGPAAVMPGAPANAVPSPAQSVAGTSPAAAATTIGNSSQSTADNGGTNSSGSSGMGGSADTGAGTVGGLVGAGAGLGLGIGAGFGFGGAGGMGGLGGGRMAPAPRAAAVPSSARPVPMQSTSPGRLALSSAPASMRGGYSQSVPLPRSAPQSVPANSMAPAAPKSSSPSSLGSTATPKPSQTAQPVPAAAPAAPQSIPAVARADSSTRAPVSPAPAGAVAGTTTAKAVGPAAPPPASPSSSTGRPSVSTAAGSAARPVATGSQPRPNFAEARPPVNSPFASVKSRPTAVPPSGGATPFARAAQTPASSVALHSTTPGKLALGSAPATMTGVRTAIADGQRTGLRPQAAGQTSYPTAPPEGCWAERRNCTPGQTYILTQPNNQCPQGNCAFVYQDGPNGHGAIWTPAGPGNSTPGAPTANSGNAGVATTGGPSTIARNATVYPPTLPWLQNGYNPLFGPLSSNLNSDNASPTSSSASTMAGGGDNVDPTTGLPSNPPRSSDAPNSDNGGTAPAGASPTEPARSNTNDNSETGDTPSAPPASNDVRNNNTDTGAPAGALPNDTARTNETPAQTAANAGNGNGPQAPGEAMRDDSAAPPNDQSAQGGALPETASNSGAAPTTTDATNPLSTEQISSRASQVYENTVANVAALQDPVIAGLRSKFESNLAADYKDEVSKSQNLGDFAQRVAGLPLRMTDEVLQATPGQVIQHDVKARLENLTDDVNRNEFGKVVNNEFANGDPEAQDFSDTAGGQFYDAITGGWEGITGALKRVTEVKGTLTNYVKDKLDGIETDIRNFTSGNNP